jgi:hypothetical protein
MLDPVELRRLALPLGRVIIDCDGRPMDWVVDGDAPAPGLLVAPITEAVKKIEAGTIVHHLSRDTLWAVEGFLLDVGLLEGLPDRAISPSELSEQVRASGYEWHLTPSGLTEVL